MIYSSAQKCVCFFFPIQMKEEYIGSIGTDINLLIPKYLLFKINITSRKQTEEIYHIYWKCVSIYVCVHVYVFI